MQKQSEKPAGKPPEREMKWRGKTRGRINCGYPDPNDTRELELTIRTRDEY